jgi:hypothetical protein
VLPAPATWSPPWELIFTNACNCCLKPCCNHLYNARNLIVTDQTRWWAKSTRQYKTL